MSDMITCNRCSQYYHVSWDEKGGCPSCRGIVSYPLAFYKTETYRQERDQKYKSERLERFTNGIPSLTPEPMTQSDFDWIVIDLLTVKWRDQQGYEYVEKLVRHILSVDNQIRLPEITLLA